MKRSRQKAMPGQQEAMDRATGHLVPEREGKIGARVMYCGHAGWFVADIIMIGNVAVVRASSAVTASNIICGRDGEATHHLSDFPGPVFWRPELGIFVVPVDNLQAFNRGGK